jgi:hypothetical protein
MKDIISCGVSSIKMDKSGKYCLIKFYPEKRDSEDELKKTFFFTIVSVSELKAYGGIPMHCDLRPSDEIENEQLFDIEPNYKAAKFEGISYYGSSKGLFWSFKEISPSIDDIISYIDLIIPSAKFEFRELLTKHIINK